MRFQVPQFIEVEDKIFGQLTLRQFIYLVGGGGLSFLIYTLTDSLVISAPFIIVVMSLSAALAFFKVNNKPFVSIMESAFKYYFGNKLYIWKREEPKHDNKQKDAKPNYASIMVPKISDSKLKDLSWSLDIRESVYSNQKQK